MAESAFELDQTINTFKYTHINKIAEKPFVEIPGGDLERLFKFGAHHSESHL